MDEYRVTVGGHELTVRIGANGTMFINGEEEPITIVRLGTYEFLARNGTRHHRLAALQQENGYLLSADGLTLESRVETNRERLIREHARERTTEDTRAEIHAPMPAMVVRVDVVEGQIVEAGQGLLVLEAMKMENELRSPRAGVVKAVLARPGIPVEKGAILMLLE